MVKKTLQFEVLRPAKVSVPYDVKKILFVVNRNEVNSKYFFNDNDTSYNVELEYVDLLIDTIYKTIVSVNLYVGKFDVSGILFVNEEMDLKNCRKFATANNVDGLIILENLYFILFQVPYKNPENDENRELWEYVTYSTNWKFYDNVRLKYSDLEVIEDNWIDTGFLKTKENPKEEIKKVANFIGGFCGKSYFERISPQWEKVSREVIISENTGFKRAYSYLKRNIPDSARLEYEKYLDCTSSRIRSSALYNIAICYEMSDNIARADEILDLLLLEKNRKYYKKYSNLLFYRIIERKRLENQVDW